MSHIFFLNVTNVTDYSVNYAHLSKRLRVQKGKLKLNIFVLNVKVNFKPPSMLQNIPTTKVVSKILSKD